MSGATDESQPPAPGRELAVLRAEYDRQAGHRLRYRSREQ
jgi:hypothetical protein